MNKKTQLPTHALASILIGSAALAAAPAASAAAAGCRGLPSHSALKDELTDVVTIGGNAGLGNNMWGTVVNRDGQVCAVVFTGLDRDDQWPGSRVISAQKASTGNAFSLAGLALSSGNLYGTVLEQGSLFGLQHSNPVDPLVAYGSPSVGGNANNYGQPNDPLVGWASSWAVSTCSAVAWRCITRLGNSLADLA